VKHFTFWVALVLIVLLFVSNGAGNAAAPTPAATPAHPTVTVGQSDSQRMPERPAAPASKTTPVIAATPEPPVSSDYPDDVIVLKDERHIGEYTVRLWRDTAADEGTFHNILIISQPGQADVKIEAVSELNDLTGSDFTGAGYPDLAIETYSGGAHCCFSTLVYELGPTLKKVLESPAVDCEGEFKDLDNDGKMEFITCDNAFAYEFCCFAGSPLVTAVMRYEPGRGYVPASPHYPQVYADDIVRDRQLAIGAIPDDKCEWDSTTKCSILPLVLDYLYSGRQDQAFVELHRLYRFEDEDAFRKQILEKANASSLFVFP
jgi:hypothetical protein